MLYLWQDRSSPSIKMSTSVINCAFCLGLKTNYHSKCFGIILIHNNGGMCIKLNLCWYLSWNLSWYLSWNLSWIVVEASDRHNCFHPKISRSNSIESWIKTLWYVEGIFWNFYPGLNVCLVKNEINLIWDRNLTVIWSWVWEHFTKGLVFVLPKTEQLNSIGLQIKTWKYFEV